MVGTGTNVHIINTTSHSGRFGLAVQTSFKAHKVRWIHSVHRCASARVENARYGVTVNAIPSRDGTHLSEALAN